MFHQDQGSISYCQASRVRHSTRNVLKKKVNLVLNPGDKTKQYFKSMDSSVKYRPIFLEKAVFYGLFCFYGC